MKSKLKHFLLLTLGFMAVWGCQKDDSYNPESIQNNKNYKITKLSFSDLERMNGVLEKIREAELKGKKESAQLRTITEIRGFRVNTDNVLMVEKNGIRSLNFEIIEEEEENEKHRNLVLNQENDDSYSVHIVEYDLTQEEKEILRTGEQININGKASLVIEEEEGEKIVAVSELIEDNDDIVELQSSVFNNSTLVARGRKRCECEGEYQGGGGTPIIITGVSSFEFLHMDWGWGPATPIDLGITLPGDSGGGGNPVTVSPVVSPANSYFNQFLVFYLFDKPDLQNWLNDPQNSEIREEIEDYINQPFSLIIGGPSQQEQKNQRFEFAEEIINAGVNNTLISAKPFFKYPLNSNYDTLYPNFTMLVKDYIPTLKDNSDLIQTIHNLTGVSHNNIISDLQWGKGAEIHIEQLGLDSNGEQYMGKFNPSQPNKIYIDIDLVNLVETWSNIENPTPEQEQQLSMLYGLVTFSVCLHEYVHYADYAFDGIMSDTEELELGLLFEATFIGGYYEFDPSGNIVLIKAD